MTDSLKALVLRQHNAISEARYDMSALEKNILYLLMAQIKDSDQPGKVYKVCVKTLAREAGPFSLKELRQATTNLLKQTYRIRAEDGSLLIVGLMTVVAYLDEEQLLKIKISKNILPYFILLKKKFTEFQLSMALHMRSKYSKRLYEMLSQYKEVGYWEVPVLELKERLSLIDRNGKEIYSQWSAFKAQVLDTARREINEYTELQVSYQAKKGSRKYTHLKFKILKKKRTASDN